MSWSTALPPLCLVFFFFLNLIPVRHRKIAIIPGILGALVFAFFEIKTESARVNRDEEQNKLVEQQRELVEQQSKLLEQQRENLRHEDERQEQLLKDQRELPKQREQQFEDLLDKAFTPHLSQ